MKRLFSLLLVIAMLFGICTIFTACDDSYSVSDEDDDDDKKKDDDEDDGDDEVEPTLILKGLKIVLPEDFELENQNEYEGDNSAQAFFIGDSYSVAVSCGPLTGDMEGMSAKELRDYILEQTDPENEDSEVGEYDKGSKNKTPYFYAVKDDETMAIVGAFYADGEYAWQVRVMTNEDSEDYSVEEMIDLVTGWKYKAPSAEDNEDEGSNEDPDDPEDPTQAPPVDMPTEPTVAPVEPSEPVEQIGNFTIPEGGYDGSPVTITFFHNMGSMNQDILNAYIKEFNKLYPNITVQHESLGGYDMLKDTISSGIQWGTTPNIAYCQPDQVAYYRYISENALVTLDSLMFSEIPVYRADGSKETLGLTGSQFNDFYTGFMEATRIYGDDMAYTLPLMKTPEVLYYNKTFFDANGIPVPTTWDEMEEICRIIKKLNPNCIPLGCDSERNLLVNYAMQKGAGYVDSDGNLKFNDSRNQSFIGRMRHWYQDGLITTMNICGGYTSSLFVMESCYMSIGSGAGAQYYAGDFEVGVAMVPQAARQPWVVSQGPDLCVFQKDNPQEVIASWLFIKFLTTNTEFQAAMSMSNGYLPVIRSATEHPIYQSWLNSAGGFGNLSALSVKTCLTFADYCNAPYATRYGDYLTEAVSNLVVNCMTSSMYDENLEIMELFNQTMTDVYSNG